MADQRSQLFIKKEFQKNMVLEVLLITFILINAVVITGYLLIDSIADVHDLKQYLAYTIAAVEIVGFIIVYRFNLRASHRIAGPVYSFEQGLKAIDSGDLGFSLKFRQPDHFHEVGEQLNQTVDMLRQRIDRAQTLANAIQQHSATDSKLVDQLVEELSYFDTRTRPDTDREAR